MPHSTPLTTRTNPIDALVIGSGPAGLAFGLSFARLLHTCIIFSSPSPSSYRNAKSIHMHGIPTWEDRSPADFRAAARKDILNHYDTTFFEDVAIASIEKDEKGYVDADVVQRGTLFKATDENGRVWWGRKVVIVSGVRDIMPDIEGYEECWVSGIFHCLFCHGYEERGAASAGVLAIDDCAPPQLALHLARYANRLAKKVTIYTNGKEDVRTAIESALAALKYESKTRRNVTVEGKKIVKLLKLPNKAEIEVQLEGGERKVEGFLAHKPKSEQQGSWAEQLGLDLTDGGDIKASPPFNATNNPGVFAGGDSQTMMKGATIALSHGAMLAAGVAAQIEADD